MSFCQRNSLMRRIPQMNPMDLACGKFSLVSSTCLVKKEIECFRMTKLFFKPYRLQS